VSKFDPYHEWLGIDCSNASPTYYELLELEPGVADIEHIGRAAQRAKSRVRSFRPGAQAAAWARLLDEIEAAYQCLSNPVERVRYDRQLAAGTPRKLATSHLPLNAAPGNGVARNTTTAADDSESEPFEDFGLDGEVRFDKNSADPMAPMAPDAPPSSMPPVDPMAALDPMAPVATDSMIDPLFADSDDPMAPVPAFMPPAEGDGMTPGGRDWSHGSGGPGYGSSRSASSAVSDVGTFGRVEVDEAGDECSVLDDDDGGVGAPRIGRPLSATSIALARSQRSLLGPLVFVAFMLTVAGAVYVIYRQLGSPASRAMPVAAAPNSVRPFDVNGSPLGVGGSPPSAGEGRDDRVVGGGPGGFESALRDGMGADDGDASRTPTAPPRTDVGGTATTPDGGAFTSSDPPMTTPTTPMATPTTMTGPGASETTPAPPVPTAPTPEQLAQLESELGLVAAALRVHNYPLAIRHVEAADELAMRDEDVPRIERWMTAVEYARGFHQAILDGNTKLQATDVLEANGMSVAVVETGSDFIILRVRGQNRRYELAKLPLGLAVILAHQAIAPDDPATILSQAMYVAFAAQPEADDLDKARGWIAEASARLPAAKGMEKLLDDEAFGPTAGSRSAPAAGDAPKLTPAQLRQLAAALTSARTAVEDGDFERAAEQVAQAEKLAASDAHKQLVWRLKTMSEQAEQFAKAIAASIAALKPGDVIQVGTSTQLEVVRTTDKTLIVKVPGIQAAKVYQIDDLPQGLAMALGLRSLPVDEPLTKALQASYIVATNSGNAPDVEKARGWYSEAAFADPKMAGLSEVLADNYDLTE